MTDTTEATGQPDNFRSSRDLHPGLVVFDRVYQMPAVVRQVDGVFVELARPTGMEWRVAFYRLRRATPWERRQLVALGELHRQQRKGRGQEFQPVRRQNDHGQEYQPVRRLRTRAEGPKSGGEGAQPP